MIKAFFIKYNLVFKQASGTSRGVLKQKITYYLKVESKDNWGIGECGLFKGLSADDVPDYGMTSLRYFHQILQNQKKVFLSMVLFGWAQKNL